MLQFLGDSLIHAGAQQFVNTHTLCDPARRAALMHEAATLVDSVPPAMRALHSVRRWHERIALGLREGNAAMAAPALARSAG